MPDAGAISRWLFLVLLVPLIVGCSVRKLAVSKLADTLAETGTSFASDEDPELIRDAVPFALKTMEALLEEQPEHVGLRLAACSGFTQYGFAFVELDAVQIEEEDWERAEAMRERALKLYLRARGHCLYALSLDHPGIVERLRVDPEGAAAEIGVESIDLTYWTALSWGAAVAAGADQPELLGDLGTVGALLLRVAELDEAHDDGGVQEALMAYESASTLSGGSYEKAEAHYRRAAELAGDDRVSLFVGYAQSVARARQDRDAYIEMLERALAVDLDAAPEYRVSNTVFQRHARWLLDRVDDYFLPPLDEIPEEGGDE